MITTTRNYLLLAFYLTIFRIMKWKQSIDTEDLCADLPQPIKDVTEHVRSMVLYEEPDYTFIEDKLIEAALGEGITLSRNEHDHMFQWDFKQGWEKLYIESNSVSNIKQRGKYKRKSNSSDIEGAGLMWIVSPLILASRLRKDEEKVS